MKGLTGIKLIILNIHFGVAISFFEWNWNPWWVWNDDEMTNIQINLGILHIQIGFPWESDTGLPRRS